MSSDSELDIPFPPKPRTGRKGPIIIPQATNSARVSEYGGRRGRGSYQSRGWRPAPKIQSHSPVRNRPLGELLTTIDFSTASIAEAVAVPEIEGCEYVASFNWMNRKNPTMLVPGMTPLGACVCIIRLSHAKSYIGMPPKWAPPIETRRLSQDEGDFHRDPNAARYSSYTLEPMIRALYAMRPDHASSAIDIVACGSTLGNLLRFCRSAEKKFYFDVEIVGNTLFLIRRENSPTELIPDVYGYGHTFPDEYTTWDSSVAGSTSHQRIIQYMLGGLRCLIRSETDGYLPSLTSQNEESTNQAKSVLDKSDDLADILASASEKFTVSETTPDSTLALQINRSAESIPQGAIFDLKTRTIKKVFDEEEILPRLWINQTPNFVLAYHTTGLFEKENIHIKDMRDPIKAWERRNGEALARLVTVLQKIREVARDTEDGKLDVMVREYGVLEIRRRVEDDEVGDVLPGDLMGKWVLDTSS